MYTNWISSERLFRVVHWLSLRVPMYPLSVCCSVLQCVAVCCSVLQCVAVCCSVLQCVAVCCSLWKRTVSLYSLSVNCSLFQSSREVDHLLSTIRPKKKKTTLLRLKILFVKQGASLLVDVMVIIMWHILLGFRTVCVCVIEKGQDLQKEKYFKKTLPPF